MKTNIEAANRFPYIAEIAAWRDHGDTEYWGAKSEEKARELLARALEDYKEWAKEWLAVDPDVMDCKWEPETSAIRVRPEPDEDGEYPPVWEWPEL